MADIDLNELLTVENPEALIAYLRDHPEIMSLIGDRESLGTRHLWRILVAAVVLAGLSKLLVAQFDNVFDQMVSDIVVDLVFEMGAALIGSVATVIFIEQREKKQFIENLEFRDAVQRRIAQLNARAPS